MNRKSRFFSQYERGISTSGALYALANTDLAQELTADQLKAAATEFNTRFGIARTVTRNENLKEVLTKPGDAITNINNAYNEIAAHLVKQYNDFYRRLTLQNVPPNLAQERADKYILPLIESEMELIALKFPYSFGTDPQQVNKEMTQTLFNTPEKPGELSMKATNEIVKTLQLANGLGKG